MKIKVWTNPIHFVAFGFGAGLLPKAPGTWGTLVAIPIYLLVQSLPIPGYLLAMLVITGVSVWVSQITSRDLAVHDHPGIVIDEIVGYLWTMFLILPTWGTCLAGFFLFRLFDIWKPWPIRLVDKRVRGGVGIVLDDLLAGLFASLILHAAFWAVI